MIQPLVYKSGSSLKDVFQGYKQLGDYEETSFLVQESMKATGVEEEMMGRIEKC